MSDDDRLDHLERRLLVLEEIIRERLPERPDTPALGGAMPTQEPPLTRVEPVVRARPVPTQPATPSLSTEQWFGQRGMLGIGVLLLILAGAYFLKVAIDRGWVSPAARCVMAVLAGHAVIALGWRLHRRGTATYGAALMGGGAGLIYLGIWAAARWYTLVSPNIGIIGLLYVGFSMSAIAWQLDIEALGAAAALGAMVGPIVISPDAGSANALLIYLAGVGATLGVVAARRAWRITMLFIVLTAFLLAPTAIPQAQLVIALCFAVIGGWACLSLRRRWVEIAVIGFLGAWACLMMTPVPAAAPWLIVACGGLLAAPNWWDALRRHVVWPDGGVITSGEQWSLAESAVFYLTPYMLAGALARGYHELSIANPGFLAMILAIPYLVAGYARLGPFRVSRSPFALVGTTAAAFAAIAWPGAELGGVTVLLAMALLWAGLDHFQHRLDGRWYSLLALALAGARFVTIVRPPDSAAFRDLWALLLWAMIALTVAFAMGVWRIVAPDDRALSPPIRGAGRAVLTGAEAFLDNNRTLPPQVRPLLWVVAGAMLFLGVTNELARLVGQFGLTPEVVRLAGGLAVSAWWALYAGALVVFGFYRKLSAVRIAGLLVAGLAVLKVLFFDLANLDQLYRVGSFIILAIVLLLVAYLYHRHAANLRSEVGAISTDRAIDA